MILTKESRDNTRHFEYTGRLVGILSTVRNCLFRETEGKEEGKKFHSETDYCPKFRRRSATFVQLFTVN
ncbi:hypothetical protein SCA6_008583 [Theobroma cacao]